MKLWVDDVRPAPDGYFHVRSVNEAIRTIITEENFICDPLRNYHPWNIISVIDIDHDAGEFSADGGDYIKLLDWLEATRRNYPIRIHSQNPVGIENMRRIIQRNGWKEIV